ncbi:hypothetical protein EJB05_25252 [Eragrostis curvula]|uniref:Uncharacterized protein n=1 Tax=Eragrostis curvula TaxID=38414 RepID=A0A5J9VBU9_9POAL|nr:hypothetical protein EJB05_25252 [Eragrostis curvula]
MGGYNAHGTGAHMVNGQFLHPPRTPPGNKTSGEDEHNMERLMSLFDIKSQYLSLGDPKVK